MITYQELQAVIGNEENLKNFIVSVVNSHTASDEYKVAAAAEAYYAKRNITIEKFQKFLYNANGNAYPDLFSANYKLKTLFFRRFVIQQVQYVLSNGVQFENDDTIGKLGENFEYVIQELAKKAMVDGVSFGFWNIDHVEVLSFVDTPKTPGFAPIYDAENGALRAGVKYWAIGDQTKRFVLYLDNGYIEYIQRYGEKLEVLNPLRPYKLTVGVSAIGEQVQGGENYPGFPIMPIYANDLRESEIIGVRESIDCYDFIKSGLANTIDDTSSIYWVIKNAGGMDDVDIARFLDRMRVLRAAAVDADADGGAEAHTLDVPYEARETMLNRLRNDLYEDFQLLDLEKALTGNLTATAIRMAYQNQDDKCGDFEYCLRDFISRLLKLLGIEDEPQFKWNRIANQLEETQMVMTAANYLDNETILKKLPFILPEEVDEILKRLDEEGVSRVENIEIGGATNDVDVPAGLPADFQNG